MMTILNAIIAIKKIIDWILEGLALKKKVDEKHYGEEGDALEKEIQNAKTDEERKELARKLSDHSNSAP